MYILMLGLKNTSRLCGLMTQNSFIGAASICLASVSTERGVSMPKTLHLSLPWNRLALRVAVTRSFLRKAKRQVFHYDDDDDNDDDDDCDGAKGADQMMMMMMMMTMIWFGEFYD
jgi:hypothetical protein